MNIQKPQGRKFDSYTVSFCFYKITMKGVENMNAKLFIKKNASTILTGLGTIGVVATSVMAVKATPRALDLIEKAEKEKGDELTKWETVKVAGPTYLPAILLGTSTIACIFGAQILNQRQQAALMSAYDFLEY